MFESNLVLKLLIARLTTFNRDALDELQGTSTSTDTCILGSITVVDQRFAVSSSTATFQVTDWPIGLLLNERTSGICHLVCWSS